MALTPEGHCVGPGGPANIGSCRVGGPALQALELPHANPPAAQNWLVRYSVTSIVFPPTETIYNSSCNCPPSWPALKVLCGMPPSAASDLLSQHVAKSALTSRVSPHQPLPSPHDAQVTPLPVPQPLPFHTSKLSSPSGTSWSLSLSVETSLPLPFCSILCLP